MVVGRTKVLYQMQKNSRNYPPTSGTENTSELELAMCEGGGGHFLACSVHV